jgi:type VI secretion system FHA domain protein
MPGYMAPARAFANAFDDLRAHELAIMAGMRAALAGVLKRFDPAAIEARLQVPTVMDKVLAANRKARMWDRMVELYTQMAVEADSDFHKLFGEAFGEAYEEQVERLRQSRR